MKDYLFVFRGGLDFTQAPQDQVQQILLKWKAWVDDLTAKGIYNGGERLTRGEAALIKGAAKQTTNTPYIANGEQVGGYISIKAANLQSAIDIAKNCPIFLFDGNVEIREIARM